MRYSNTIKWLSAIWNQESPEAQDTTISGGLENVRTYATLVIHLKGGRLISMRMWVESGQDITEHTLWKGLSDWLSNNEDDSPYCITTEDGTYHSYIVKSEVTQIILTKEKDNA